MRKLGLWAVRPKRNTSKRHPEHQVYPYLLRGRTIDQPNQVWAADITYIPMRQGFLYLVAIIDWATRRVLSWRLSNTLTAGFCVEALSEALVHKFVRMMPCRCLLLITIIPSEFCNRRCIGYGLPSDARR